MALKKNIVQSWMGNTANSFLFHFTLLFVVTTVLRATPLPDSNEMLYLVLPIKHYNPTYLLNDWTLSGPWRSHYVFNALIGPFTLILPLQIIGWFGRIICWSGILIGLLRLGLKFRIPLWTVTLSILLLLIYEPNSVAGVKLLAGFQASRVAWILLLFSLNAFINEKDLLASMLLGLTFSFHPAVGLFSILALGLSLCTLRYPFRRLFRIVLCTAIFSAPGVIPLLSSVFGSSGLSAHCKEFLVLVKMPFHLDPLSWPKRDILYLYILLWFNWMHYRKNREHRAFKLCMYFQLFLCLFFSLGLLCRFTEYYSFLMFFPFRLFPALVLPFFFFHLMHAYHYRNSKNPSLVLVGIGFLALLSFGDPIGRLVDQVRSNIQLWTEGSQKLHDKDITRAFKWISTHTPDGSIAILPPWRVDGWYITQRAQIACSYFPYDYRCDEWLERVQALVGKIVLETTDEDFETYYNNLTEEEIAAIVEQYGGEYLVSKGEYSYPVLFDSGTYKVYLLKNTKGIF